MATISLQWRVSHQPKLALDQSYFSRKAYLDEWILFYVSVYAMFNSSEMHEVCYFDKTDFYKLVPHHIK